MSKIFPTLEEILRKHYESQRIQYLREHSKDPKTAKRSEIALAVSRTNHIIRLGA